MPYTESYKATDSRLLDLSRPLGLAAASSCQKPPEATTTDSYINPYNYICRYTPATKLGMLTQHDVTLPLIKPITNGCYYK